MRGAELTGRTVELEWACLAAAFDAFAKADAPPGVSLFVNNGVGLRLEHCPADLLPSITRAEAGLRVFVEVNDHALAADPSGVLTTVDRARELGWGVSVDDVGTSLGCLSVLPMVRADVIKLDARLLRTGSARDLAPVVAPLLRHIEANDATLVVKGIETVADMRLAHALGATFGQGHHVAEPGPLMAGLHQPRDVVPMIGGWSGAPAVASPFELVADRRLKRMAESDMREIGSYFAERAMGAGSRPLVLVGMGDHVADELAHDPGAAALARLAEQSVLLAAFGVGLPAEPAPGVRGVHLPLHDPLARQPFLVILTEALAFAMVAVHPVGQDDLIDVVLTQDPRAVDDIAQHLLRRIPYGDSHTVLPIDVLPAGVSPGGQEPGGQRSGAAAAGRGRGSTSDAGPVPDGRTGGHGWRLPRRPARR